MTTLFALFLIVGSDTVVLDGALSWAECQAAIAAIDTESMPHVSLVCGVDHAPETWGD